MLQVGGYYDGGDYTKVTGPLAFTLSLIGWTVLDFQNGYESSRMLDDVHQMLRWGLEYLLEAHYKADALIIQVSCL